MPDLPTLTLGQAHYDRVVASFPGATGATKAANYQNWLVGQLIDFVRAVEIKKIETASEIDKQAKLDAVDASLPPRPMFPLP